MTSEAGRRHLLLIDVLAALTLTVVYVGFARIGSEDGQASFTGPVWLGLLIAAAAGLPIAVRRLWPVPVLGVVVVALSAAALLDIVHEPFATAGLAAYVVGLAEHTRRAMTALAVAVPVAVVAVYLGAAVVTPTEDVRGALALAALVALVIGGGWAAGYVVRGRRADARRRLRAEQERAVEEERLRIARELHDIVSHHLSLIAVRAGVAGHVAEADPVEARTALKDIETASRGALDEMRGALGVLRTDAAPRGPAAGVDDLAALADDARRAGVDVDLAVRGGEGLTEGMQATVHRIVQEALTNVVRHAAPTSCAVTVDAVPGDEVRIDVLDDGPPGGVRRGGHALPGGHGLLGVRERAALYGGSLDAGPRPAGGFAVHVRLPIQSGRHG